MIVVGSVRPSVWLLLELSCSSWKASPQLDLASFTPLELISRIIAVSEGYTLKQERLSPQSEAAACTLSLELCVTLLFCPTSATPGNSQSPSSVCAADTEDENASYKRD